MKKLLFNFLLGGMFAQITCSGADGDWPADNQFFLFKVTFKYEDPTKYKGNPPPEIKDEETLFFAQGSLTLQEVLKRKPNISPTRYRTDIKIFLPVKSGYEEIDVQKNNTKKVSKIAKAIPEVIEGKRSRIKNKSHLQKNGISSHYFLLRDEDNRIGEKMFNEILGHYTKDGFPQDVDHIKVFGIQPDTLNRMWYKKKSMSMEDFFVKKLKENNIDITLEKFNNQYEVGIFSGAYTFQERKATHKNTYFYLLSIVVLGALGFKYLFLHAKASNQSKQAPSKGSKVSLSSKREKKD